MYFDAKVCERITKQLNVRIYVILLGISASTSAQLHGRSIPKMNEITKGWNDLQYYNQILKHLPHKYLYGYKCYTLDHQNTYITIDYSNMLDSKMIKNFYTKQF